MDRYETPENYIDSLPEDRQEVLSKIRQIALEYLPKGFEEVAGSMIGYVVPYSLYANGYHCPPAQPLPFLNIASQKNFVAIYHMGMYADPELLKWFTSEYPKHCNRKLDMGKSCIRFKKIEDIPYSLIGELFSKMTPRQWIDIYENTYVKK